MDRATVSEADASGVSPATSSAPLLSVRDLSVSFPMTATAGCKFCKTSPSM